MPSVLTALPTNAAYLALAEAREEPMLTGDLRLYNTVRNHLDWVRRIGDGLLSTGGATLQQI